MPVTKLPATSQVQFIGAQGIFEVDNLYDPSGNPTSVLDADLGFTVRGKVTLPGWLSGKGIVKIAADQIGGPFDRTLASATITVAGSPSQSDPGVMVYTWTIVVPGGVLPDTPDMYELGAVFFLLTAADGHTDIGAYVDLGVYMAI